ncbi:TRAP transporter small permease [Cellulomonas fimi]|uniref:TRAP transporter small permease n=1 Tax=Cellulomonas fimi TaxID=1708 RepID=A0A7Y0QIA3_CELFI|nr:TRAP transporter small permease [Cellulomonas fimi]NMR21135.1 TRAP transporter small permease [Cellulomonas fimi]
MTAVKSGLDRILAVICWILFALLVVTVVWQVFSRQVLDAPSTWSEELARYEFVWLGFFAAALVFSERGHIAVDFLVRKFSENAQRVVAIGVQVLIIVFALGALVWGGWRAAMGAWGQSLSALPTQLGVMYLVMPIAGLFITFYAVYHLQLVVRRKEEPLGYAEVDEAI